MQLRDALTQIEEIRRQMARAEVFRGYRAATTAFSAVVALAAAAVQRVWVGEGSWDGLYVWLVAAGVSLAVVGAEMAARYRRSGSALGRQMTRAAVEQFVPCLVAGGLLTFVLSYVAPETLDLLPAVWATLFGLGVFASRRVLPRGTAVVGGYYLLAGVMAAAERGRVGFAAQMAVAFGGGQLLAAAVLYWTLERGHGRE